MGNRHWAMGREHRQGQGEGASEGGGRREEAEEREGEAGGEVKTGGEEDRVCVCCLGWFLKRCNAKKSHFCLQTQNVTR